MLLAGLDIGTSGVKCVLVDLAADAKASASRTIVVSRPRPGWSEQHPDLWWQAVVDVFDQLAAEHPSLMAQVASIGLSGQMLGPVLIDKADRPLDAVLLWNDERSLAECRELLERVPDIGLRTNGTPDPGIGAPKLLWLAKHRPEVLAAADCLLLPKDYVRLCLTGRRASEPSDAGGTMLMDCASGRWDEALCAAAGWSSERLPPVIQSWESGGALKEELAHRWGLTPGIPVAAGAGDNMACSLGLGAARPGDCVVTIGTSAVVCIVDSRFRPAPDQAVLTSGHAAPDAFLSMGVVMSATASLDWLAAITATPVPVLAEEAEQLHAAGRAAEAPVMRPSLNGIRTPDNRPNARGAIGGLALTTDRAQLAWSLLEGIAFQILDCVEAQRAAGLSVETVAMAGGGARNPLWCRMVASLLDRPVALPKGRDLAACLGAARLAACAAGLVAPDRLALRPEAERMLEPDAALRALLLARLPAYRSLAL